MFVMNSVVEVIKKMDYICRTSKYIYSFFVCVVIFASFANGAPQMHHTNHHSWTSSDSDDDSVTKMEWVNPCGGELLPTLPTKFDTVRNDSVVRRRSMQALKPLKEAIPNFILRLNDPTKNFIDTSDIGDWSKLNKTYKFLHRINATMQPNLPRRYIETQKYVGAFQYLLHKQKKFDRIRNEGNEQTIEIDNMLTLAKNLLCEIEYVINSTRQPMPVVFTRKRMDDLLTFRNNNSIEKFGNVEIDELDNKFAKVRFHEYVQNLQQVLNKPLGKKNLKRKRGQKLGGPKNGKKGKKGTKLNKGKGPRKLAKRKNLKKKNTKLPNLSLA